MNQIKLMRLQNHRFRCQFYQTLFNNFIQGKMATEFNMTSQVKINGQLNNSPHVFNMEVDLEEQSNESIVLQPQRSITAIKLKPINVTLNDAPTANPQNIQPQSSYQPIPALQHTIPRQPRYQQVQPLQANNSIKPSARNNQYQALPRDSSNTNSPAVSKGTTQKMRESNLRESEVSSPTRFNFHKKIKPGYEMANYIKALYYQNTQSYRIKTKAADGDDDYEQMSIWSSNQELRQFGLGVYLFFQFLKRLTVTLLLMSAVLIFALIESYHGTGLSKYTSSSSYSITLAKFSLGHIENGDKQTYLIITVCDIISMLILFFFWIHWRSFHNSILEEMERDHKIVNPVNYVVAVQSFYDKTTNPHTLQQELKNYIDNIYKGSYQIQVVYNYLGNFDKFIQYDQQIQVLERQHQIIKQTGKNTEKYDKQQLKLNQLQKQIQNFSQAFQPMYAFIHFRTLKAKMAFLNHCKRFKLQNTLGQAFQRAICCVPIPPERLLFLKKFPVMLRNSKLSRPEQINWRNIDISNVGRFVRWSCSIFFVVLAIIVTSSLIGLCTLYVSSTSSCQNYNSPTGTVANQILAIQNSTNVDANTYCYCNENLASIYTDTVVNTFCSTVSNKVLITNALQISASIISSVTNIILGIIIGLIAKYLLRPNSIPKEYLFIFWGALISNFINTAVIPLILNGKILQVQFVSYLKFINFINFDNLSLFQDFSEDWYALISPYYINFLIIGCFISPLIGLIIFSFKSCIKNWRLKSNCEDNDKQNPLIQKQANKKITSLQFQYAEETANVLLILFLGVLYSGLLPLAIPILTIGMFWIYVCKKTVLLKYSAKIAADETLNESIINFLPFVILAHGLFSIWSHTSSNVFEKNVQIYSLNLKIFNNTVDRVFADILMLAEPALILVVIIIDYTLINFFSGLASCCKDEFQMPVQWAAVENQQFSARIQKVNILGSYKLANNPTYGHAIKAYKELVYRNKKEGFQVSKDHLNPEFSK